MTQLQAIAIIEGIEKATDEEIVGAFHQLDHELVTKLKRWFGYRTNVLIEKKIIPFEISIGT